VLAQSEEHIGTTNGIEAVENCRVGAIGKCIGVIWNGHPHAANEIRGELRNEQPGCVRASRSHDNIGAHPNGKDLVRVRHWTDDASQINFAKEPMNGTHVVKLGRKSTTGSSKSHWAGADVLRGCSTILIGKCKWRWVGSNYDGVKTGSGIYLQDIGYAGGEIDRRVVGSAIDGEIKSGAGCCNDIGMELGLAVLDESEAKRKREQS